MNTPLVLSRDITLVTAPQTAGERRAQLSLFAPGRCSTRARHRLSLAILTIALAIWGAVDVRNRGRINPHDLANHKTDFTVYTEAGAAFFDGRDPYSVTNVRGWGYLYLPLMAILVSPLHGLAPETQVTIWFVLSVLMTYGCYRESVHLARLALAGSRTVIQRLPTWIGCCALTAVTLPALNCMQRGQIGVAKLYFLLLGCRLIIEHRSCLRSMLGGIVLALPITLKITPVLPVAYLLIQQLVLASKARDARLSAQASGFWAGTAAGLVLCIVLIPASLIGWEANCRHLQRWWNLVAVKADSAAGDEFAGNSYSVRNQSFTNAVHRFGDWAQYAFAGGLDDRAHNGGAQPESLSETPSIRTMVLAVRIASLALVALLAIALARQGDTLGQLAGFGLSCAATLIVSPIARGHYYVLLLPAALFVPCWFLQAQRLRAARWLALAPAVLVSAHYVLMDFTGRIGLLGLGIAVWYWAAAACVLLVLKQQMAPRGAGSPLGSWRSVLVRLAKRSAALAGPRQRTLSR